MKRARFAKEQIIAILKEHEAGAKTADLARKHGISEATIYNWKAEFGGMEILFRPRPNSLAIDAGSNQTTDASKFDYDGTLRPQGQRVDIGAFEAATTSGAR